MLFAKIKHYLFCPGEYYLVSEEKVLTFLTKETYRCHLCGAQKELVVMKK